MCTRSFALSHFLIFRCNLFISSIPPHSAGQACPLSAVLHFRPASLTLTSLARPRFIQTLLSRKAVTDAVSRWTSISASFMLLGFHTLTCPAIVNTHPSFIASVASQSIHFKHASTPTPTITNPCNRKFSSSSADSLYTPHLSPANALDLDYQSPFYLLYCSYTIVFLSVLSLDPRGMQSTFYSRLHVSVLKSLFLLLLYV